MNKQLMFPKNQEEFLKNTSDFENHLINYFNFINDVIIQQNEKINALVLEINNLNGLLNKKVELVVLEFESNLDKQKQLHLKTMDKLNEINELIENIDNEVYSNVISKPEILEGNDLNEPDNDNHISDLKSKIEDLNSLISDQSSQIYYLNKNLADKDETILSLVDRINYLDEESEIEKLNMDEKDKTIGILSDENNILKSIINEKDKTIDSFNREG